MIRTRSPKLAVLVLAVAVVVALATAGVTPPDVGAQAEKLGKVHFETTCSKEAQAQFDHAIAWLHSFAFQSAIRAFNQVAQTDPTCGMAHWGLAISKIGNPLAGATPPKDLQDGAAAVVKAQQVSAKSQREKDYIAAISQFYTDFEKVDQRTRGLAYEKAMEVLASKYPQDTEASIFYALALNITLNPADKTYANQLKAAGILEKAFAAQPDHPGIAHYLIHSYDFPPIAQKGLPAARRYAGIAPDAPHAQHMPSHIFTRVGAWQDSIDTNRKSAEAAKAELRMAKLEAGSYNALHAMDYIVYAALQLGKDKEAAAVLEEMRGITKIDVEHFAAAFAFTAVPSRYALERRQWKEAAGLTLHPQSLPWQKFPQAESVIAFARGVGAARSGDVADAKKEIGRLEGLRDAMTAAKNTYWANQAEIQRLAVAGWVARAEGKNDEALDLMRKAADREDATEKHPVTPGALAPAREMLAELLVEVGQPAKALAEYEASHKIEPNRFHGLAGAARAAEAAGDRAKAKSYYDQLIALAKNADTERPEVVKARAFRK